ncbi:MAG: hypothetical protein IJB36_01400 [Clostridia bacterium]|nr:hypothetical protein [Clostridia bacterium]
MWKTYKVVYTVPNQPGRKVTIVEAFNEIDARHSAYREHGGQDAFSANINIWEVKEM